MSVVTTAVKYAVVNLYFCESVGFLDGQCVDICTQADCLLAGTFTEDTDYTRCANTGVYHDAEVVQQHSNFGSSALFLKAEFRMFVKVVPPRLSVILQAPRSTL